MEMSNTEAITEIRTVLLGESVELVGTPPLPNTFEGTLQDMTCGPLDYIYWEKVSDNGNTAYIALCSEKRDVFLNDPRFSICISPTQYHLTIGNFHLSDPGLYRCSTYLYGDEERIVHEVDLKLVSPECSAMPNSVNIGENFSLNCTFPLVHNVRWEWPNGTLLKEHLSGLEGPSLLVNLRATENINFETFTCLVDTNRTF